MVFLIALLFLISPVSYASDFCEKHLSSLSQSLRFVLERALEKGALSESEFEAFLDSNSWSNPFTTSHAHVLTPRFRTIFNNLSERMSAVDRAEARSMLYSAAVERAGRKQISERASRETRNVLNPKLLTGLPTGSGTEPDLFPGTFQGRPVFVGNSYLADGTGYRRLLLDPQNPDASRRLIHFTQAPDVIAANKHKDWFYDIPVFATFNGRESAIFGENRLILDLTSGVESMLGNETEIPPRGKPHAKWLSKRTVGFFRADGAVLSTFAFDSEKHNLSNTDLPFFEHAGRTFAAVSFSDDRHFGYLVVIDVATGKEERRFPISWDQSIQLVHKGGHPYALLPMFIGKFTLLNLLDGTKSSIAIPDQTYARSNAVFKMNGVDHVIWGGENPQKLNILDVESEDTLQVDAPPTIKGESVKVYEYNGSTYAFFCLDFSVHYQLTAPSHAP